VKNIKIGTKLIVSFLFIAIITAAIGIYLISSIRNLEIQTNVLYDKGAVPLGMLVKTAEHAQEIRVDIMRWQLATTDQGRAAALRSMDKSYSLVKELIKGQRELVLVEAGKNVLDKLQSDVDKVVEEMHNFVKNAKINPITGASAEGLPTAISDAVTEMLNSGDTVIERRVSSTKMISDDASELATRSENIAVVILVILLIFSIGIGFLLTFSITKPLSVVVGVFSKIEKGDMTVRAKLERRDELGILSNALDSHSIKLQGIFKNLRQNTDTLASSSEEMATISMQVTSNAEDIMSQGSNTASATEQAAVNINAMASGAEQASANANEVAGAAEQMSTNMNTIATAIEEMSASISEISSNAGDASKVVHEATLRSKEATDVMNKLGAAAKEIGHVTDVIKKIADKTNLLALNATIEAASAGEAGKGFAVVAGEIKELANQSATSADDIAQRIDGIQEGTSDAVTVIKDVSDIIAKINHSVDAISSHVAQQTKASNEIASNVAQANSGAKRVASAIGEVAKGSRDIARNAGEAAKGATLVSQNVANIARSAKEGSQGAKQVNQNSGDLAKMAGELRNVLSQFRV